MAANRFVKDRGLSFRMGLSLFLNGLIYVILILAIWAILGRSTGGVIIAVLISGGAFFFQWYLSDSIAMRSMGAHEVSQQQAPELHLMVDRLCQLADMPKPRVAYSDSPVANAFATGRSPNHSVVCVTRGLLETLEPAEVEAVLSHELSHVAHRDVTVMTVAGVTGVVAGLMMRAWMFSPSRGGDRNNNAAIVMLAMTVVGAVVYALSFFLIRVLSRYRELAADRAGALLTGQPSTLASALVKITGEMGRVPQQDLRDVSAANHLAFAPAINGSSVKQLFSTHPTLQQRLDQLQRIAGQLSQRG
ncbi:zinc metalloprotease HtpX [Brevibacterium sp. 50QC2O2]|jgi:heat shock protein HtpX|uniref:zinc metalloprotease HtpX n=1 Tax=Brevibacterium TaxID=1696 RepID=UPI00211CDDC3|nr:MULTISPECIES: zinc metalloprotease HtpX [unclassified Brevibacterium]MCQ9369082.1 zinc metalloprotease HtpX [Brevibacterium sp. 91QC2O2]MCQ9385058.1 zinc metalloprotease HtpX [Brevibacterium sp. 68QC2CO]MCQ9387756.1 zinc metalloprotease HtpX [Brevibacterium sp. 50QC2O2]